jgi:carbonic anhydrase
VSVEIDDKAARQPAINSLLRRFPFDTSELLNWQGLTVDPNALLPKPVRAGVLFSGSLSHPPCTEAALWLLVQPSITVPSVQWKELAKLLGEGARPLQPANGRPFIGIRGLNP